MFSLAFHWLSLLTLCYHLLVLSFNGLIVKIINELLPLVETRAGLRVLLTKNAFSVWVRVSQRPLQYFQSVTTSDILHHCPTGRCAVVLRICLNISRLFFIFLRDLLYHNRAHKFTRTERCCHLHASQLDLCSFFILMITSVAFSHWFFNTFFNFSVIWSLNL